MRKQFSTKCCEADIVFDMNGAQYCWKCKEDIEDSEIIETTQ